MSRAGLDRVSIKQFESDLENNIHNIHKELKTAIYNPSPVLRVYIPKGKPLTSRILVKGKHDKRPLGIPIVKDSVIQQAFRQIIEPIFEKDFSDVKEIIEGKLGMKLSEDKTKLTNFKRGFRFLGYNFKGKYKGISMKSLDKLKDTIRDITRRTQGVNLKAVIDKLNPVIRGHVNYFRLGNVRKVYCSLDCWVRMRLRCFKFSGKWRTDNKRFPVHRFSKLGLLSFEREFLKKCANA